MAFLLPAPLPFSAHSTHSSTRLRATANANQNENNQQDWRAFRARLVKQQSKTSTHSDPSFAHSLVAPEAGALLIANPSLFKERQSYFHRAVILLFVHNSDGSAGIMLNNRKSQTPYTPPVPPEPFQRDPVWLGGDVGDGTLFASYPTPSVPDDVTASPSFVVLPGVSLTADVDEVARAVNRGACEPSQVRFYTRYCGWGPRQLESELQRDVWYLASVSSNYVLSHDTDTLYERVLQQLDINMT